MGGWGTDAGAVVWFVVVLLVLPVIALLILVGMVYEATTRLDRSRRLADVFHWAIAGTAVIVIAGVGAAILIG